MRLLNGAQTTLSYLGALTGLVHTCDDVRDPLIAGFVRRMLLRETVPGLPDVGIDAGAYVERCFDRLANTAVRHTNHQIATDGSQKIVQRLLNPIRDRLAKGDSIELLSVPVAGWMAYLIKASARFGRAWQVSDPFADKIAAIADRIGSNSKLLADAIVSIDAIFDPSLAANTTFRAHVVAGLDGLLSDDPISFVRQVCSGPTDARLKQPARSA